MTHSEDRQPSKTTATVGRRQLLKALGATGSAAALSTLLPGRWLKPVIETGQLPAHAQTSTFSISNLSRTLTNSEEPESCANGNSTGNLYTVTFEYLNTFGDMQPGATIDHAFQFTIGVSGSFEVVVSEANILPRDEVSGLVSYTVCSAFGLPENDAVTTMVAAVDAAGRRSNQISSTLSRPANALANDSTGTPSERLR